MSGYLYDTFIKPEIDHMTHSEFEEYYLVAEPYFEKIQDTISLYNKYYWGLQLISMLNGYIVEKYTSSKFSFFRASIYYMATYSFIQIYLINTGFVAAGEAIDKVVLELKIKYKKDFVEEEEENYSDDEQDL